MLLSLHSSLPRSVETAAAAFAAAAAADLGYLCYTWLRSKTLLWSSLVRCSETLIFTLCSLREHKFELLCIHAMLLSLMPSCFTRVWRFWQIDFVGQRALFATRCLTFKKLVYTINFWKGKECFICKINLNCCVCVYMCWCTHIWRKSWRSVWLLWRQDAGQWPHFRASQWTWEKETFHVILKNYG